MSFYTASLAFDQQQSWNFFLPKTRRNWTTPKKFSQGVGGNHSKVVLLSNKDEQRTSFLFAGVWVLATATTTEHVPSNYAKALNKAARFVVYVMSLAEVKCYRRRLPLRSPFGVFFFGAVLVLLFSHSVNEKSVIQYNFKSLADWYNNHYSTRMG